MLQYFVFTEPNTRIIGRWLNWNIAKVSWKICIGFPNLPILLRGCYWGSHITCLLFRTCRGWWLSWCERRYGVTGNNWIKICWHHGDTDTTDTTDTDLCSPLHRTILTDVSEIEEWYEMTLSSPKPSTSTQSLTIKDKSIKFDNNSQTVRCFTKLVLVAFCVVYHGSMTRKINIVSLEWVNCRSVDSSCKYSQQRLLIINIMTH